MKTRAKTKPPSVRRLRVRLGALDGRQKVMLLTAAVTVAATAAGVVATRLPDPDLAFTIPWWALALSFYVAEFAVVHLRFRRDAHSFSMSEVPLVMGLFFAPALTLIAAQLASTLVVQAAHRRLPPLKVAFNLAQFAMQTTLAIIVFRQVVSLGEPLGPAGWIATTLAVLLALAVADVLINAAIRLSGGRLDTAQMLDVVKLSTLATLMNASLGLVAVTVLANAPEAGWLALAPPVVLFVAYRAYVTQRMEGGKLQSLYEATRTLHGSPQIESALLASAHQAVKMFDVEMAEIVLFPEVTNDKPYLTAVGPKDREIVMQPIDLDISQGPWALLTTGQHAMVVEAADRLRPPQHAERYPVRDAILAPLFGPDGVIGGFLVANRLGNVSQLNSDDVHLLEALARQVSVSLENGRLEDSLVQLTELKERLEALVRSKDQFVATVSHELRTPLTAIFGLSHELQRQSGQFSPSEMDEFIGLIADQSSELSDLIDDLLVAARADSGSLNVEAQVVDLDEVLQAVLEPGGVAVRGTAGPALADPLRLRQILRNLLTNANRYGGPARAIELVERGHEVAVRVIDDGTGVPPDMAEKIFEPYESAHAPGTQPKSVGLGLGVSRSLARLMGGDLVYLREDDRTVFEVRLPAARR